jgi:O-antigen ligase
VTSNRPGPRGKPLAKGQLRTTPGASRARQSVEQRSAVPLLFLRQMPRWLLPGLLAILLIAGLALHGIGAAIALIGLALVLSWLAAVSWPRLTSGGRLGRAAVIAVVLAGAVIQATR